MASLRRYYAERGQYDRQLEILEKEAAATADPSAAAWLLYQAARLLREQLGDEERALDVLQRVLAQMPGHQMALVEMANILESLMKWQDLVDVYQKMVEAVNDRQEKVALLFKIGNLWEEKLFDEDRAVEAYKQVVELNPRYLPALQALGKLYYRKGKWSELVEMYELEVRETSDDRQKAVRLYKLAEILEERLGREEDAIARLEQSLELNPGYLPVLKSLGRLYTKYGRWESLVNMYEKELASTQDRDQQVFLLDKIGTLWDEKLNNIDKAIESYQRLLEVAPNYLPAVRTLGKLYVQADRWQELIEINNKEAQMVNDQKQVVSLLHRNAEIYEEKLNDKDKAIETYKQVLALAPAYLPALQSLGRLYFIKGRWEDLIDMYRQEIEVTTNEDQHIALLYKIGQLYEEKLLQEDKAVAAYREVLRIRPGNMAALKALIRIYSNKRDWENLIEIYQQEADTLEEPAQRATSLYRVAEICLHHLQDAERAASVLLKVLDLVPEHGLATRLLMELYTKQQNWRGLIELCERNLSDAASEKQKVRLLSLMGDVYAMRMGDLARAAELYEQALKLQPDYGPALEALERVLLSQRNFAGLLRIYRYLAESGTDPQLRLALYFQLADLKENRLQPAQPSGDELVRMLEIEPAHPEASRLLEIQYVRFGTWKGLLALYERALQVVDDKQQAVDLCMRAADLCASRLDDPAGAEHYYNEVLRLAPGYLPAISALHRMYAEQGDTAKLLRVLELEERALVDKQQALRVLKEKASLQLAKLDQPTAAVDTLLRVLDLEPADGESFERLEGILRQQQDYDRLALVLRKRVDVVEEPAQKAKLLCELAEISWKQQGRLQDAMAQFSRALEIQPSNDRAVEALAELAFLNEQWDTAVEYGNKLLELTTEAERLGPVHRRMGVIYQEHRPNLELAVQHLERACELGGDDLDVLGRLKAIHAARQAWEDVVGVLERIYAADTDRDGKIAAALEQADILEKQLNQPEQAVSALKRVLEQQPERADVIQRLSLLYETLGRWEELVESLEGFVAMLPPEREQEKIPLHLKLAQVWRERLNNVEKAIIEYKKVVSINPRHVEAHEKLAELYGSSGLYYANAIDEHRMLLDINPYRIDSYREMRRIFEQQRAFDKMLCVCSVLHYLRAADQNEEFFYGENRTKIPDRSSERLSEQEIEGILVHPQERGLVRRLMKLVRGHLHKIFPAQLERYGVGKSDRARPDDPVRNLVEGMVANLGELDVDIYLSNQPNHRVAVENTSPPALIVGEGLIKRSVVKEQRFALGRAVKLAGDGSYLALLLGEKNLAQLVAALLEPYVPQSPIVSYPGQLPAGFSKKVHKALPRKVRKELEKELQQSQDTGKVPDYAAYLKAVELSADRFGLLMCNDIAQAMLHKSRHVPDL
ncbi:MAG: tetratricopeptide repeat protein, partial [Deltaproteobacteria bacterium]